MPIFEILRAEKSEELLGPIDTVMIVPNAFSRDDQLGQAMMRPELVQLHLERTIILKLQSLGIKVIYKQHPEGKMKRAEHLFPAKW